MAHSHRTASATPAAPAGAGPIAAPAPQPAPRPTIPGANDRIRVGLVGLGQRMRGHVAALTQLAAENVDIAAICDCDENQLKSAEKVYPELAGKKLLVYNDQRKLFDDKSIDAVCFATPDHWHALQTIWACQAGKDVYVEKPCTHNIAEGRQLVEAARKYQRIVQHGTQCRSSPKIIEGLARLREGVIGQPYMARGIFYNLRGNLGANQPSGVPPGVNWDAWVGPAPLVSYSEFCHRRWYWLGNFASDVASHAIQQIDLIRWGLGLDGPPTTVQAMGGRYLVDDASDTPNTQTFACQWAGRSVLVSFEIRHWYTPGEAGFRDEYPFVQADAPVGVIFFGPQGYMIIPDHSSYYTFLGPQREPGPSGAEPGHPLKDLEHFQNWIAALRSRRGQDLHAEIEEGHRSATTCHLARIAATLGRTVRFDPQKERFLGDPAADALLARPYRPPYLLPEKS